MSRALVAIAACAALVACAPPPAQAPARVVAREADLRPDHDAEMRALIRAQAQRDHGGECGEIVLPDAAFIPIELTGGGLPEYAVSFGHALCAADGGRTTRFQGTGGPLVQFWIGSGGPARILLEQTVYGFSAGGERLVAHQHGTFCDGGAGPNLCQVTYVWNDRDRRLDVVERRYFDGSGDGTPAPVRYDDELIGR